MVIGGVRKHVTDPVLDTSVSLITPFIAYVVAEELHGSGVLAVVVAALLLGHKAPVLQTASSRIAERLNWNTIAFLLENTVFLLIGLQARWILERRRAQHAARGHDRAAPASAHWWPSSCCASPGCSPCATCWSGPARTRRGVGHRRRTRSCSAGPACAAS